MKLTFTEKLMSNGVLIITCWEDNLWCSVMGLRPDDQTPEYIRKVKDKMAKAARLPGSLRNGGIRVANKC